MRIRSPVLQYGTFTSRNSNNKNLPKGEYPLSDFKVRLLLQEMTQTKNYVNVKQTIDCTILTYDTFTSRNRNNRNYVNQTIHYTILTYCLFTARNSGNKILPKVEYPQSGFNERNSSK